jgi:hypothetical protein
VVLVQIDTPGLGYSTKNPTGTNESSSVYVVLQRIILVQMDAPASMWFHNEPYWYKWRIQCLCGSIKNHTGTNSDSRVYFVLQRIMLIQIESPGSMSFYKE